MAETRATIRARVQRLVGTAINTHINDAIKDRHKQIQRRHSFRFMEDTDEIPVSAGADTFDLPEDFKEERTSGHETTAGEWRRMGKIIKDGIGARDTTETGEPMRYRIWAGTGYIYPTAESAFTFDLEYYAWLDDIDDDEKTNDLLDELHKVIFYGVLADCFERLGNEKKADYYEGKFLYALEEAIDDDIYIAMAGQDLQMQIPG